MTLHRLALNLAFLPLLSAAEPKPTLLVQAWKHEVLGLYPVEKVRADQKLLVPAAVETLELSAARGEWEPMLLLLQGQIPLREVSVEAKDWQGPEGATLPAASVTCQRLGYIHVDEPSGTRIKQAMPYPVGTGLFPDPLLPGKGDLRPGRLLQFLLTVQVPAEAKSGLYEGAITLRYRREPWYPAQSAVEHRLPLRLRVRSFSLPQVSPLLNTSFANLRELPVEQRQGEGLAAFQKQFFTHRQTPEPLLPSPVIRVYEGGIVAVDSTAWETAVERHLAGGGTHFFLPVWDFYPQPTMAQGLYFLHHYPAVMQQRWLSAPICQEDRQLTPAFRALFGQYLKHMHAVLERRAWLQRCFITTMDEPYTAHTADKVRDKPVNNYEVIRNYVSFIREQAPGLLTFCTANPTEGLIGSIDHWCLRSVAGAKELIQAANARGEVVTFCDNYRSFIDYPAHSTRSFGWLAWQTGARGWLTFETLSHYSRAWEGAAFIYPQFSAGMTWGLGQMFYPEPLTGTPLPSLRWEMMREGCDDYEYLWLLADYLKRHPHAEAEAFLSKIGQGAIQQGGDAETASSISTDTHSSQADLHQRREQLAQWLEKFSPP